MMDRLGARLNTDNMKTSLDIVNILGKPLYCTLDAVHLVKLVRNAFGDLKKFTNAKGETISWEYIEKLHYLQLKEGVHCGNKLTQKHIDWKKDPMKVQYAVQTLSKSVSTAIAFCRDKLKLADFEGSEATCEFLNVFNDLFDVLNSKSVYGKFLKAAMAEKNQEYWNPVLEHSKEYILGLSHFGSNKPLVNGQRRQAFAGVVSLISSVRSLFNDYVLSGALKYLCTYKLSQGTYRLHFQLQKSNTYYITLLKLNYFFL